MMHPHRRHRISSPKKSTKRVSDILPSQPSSHLDRSDHGTTTSSTVGAGNGAGAAGGGSASAASSTVGGAGAGSGLGSIGRRS